MFRAPSPDTKILRSVLEEAKVGDVITYDALSKAIGRDVREYARSSMYAAMRQLRAEHNYVFAARTNVGYQRMSDVEIVVNVATRQRQSVQRKANRNLNLLRIVDYHELPEEHRMQHIVASAQFGVIASMANASSTKRIAHEVANNGKPLAIGETLAMFTKPSPTA